MSSTRPETCPTCATDPTVAPGRYCPAKSCLCGHADCYAFASWTPLARLNVIPLPKRKWREAS